MSKSKFDMKDYVNKVLNESTYYREVGLERMEATVKNIAGDINKSFIVVIPKHQIKYRGVSNGDKIHIWWRRVDEDKRPNLQLLEREITAKLEILKKHKKELEEQRLKEEQKHKIEKGMEIDINDDNIDE